MFQPFSLRRPITVVRLIAFVAVSTLMVACGGGASDSRRLPLAAPTASASAYDKDDLYRFFVIAFGAAPGVTYMGQLLDAANSGMSVKTIVNVFTTKTQFTDVYPADLSSQEFARKLVDNVAGASASSAAKDTAVTEIVAALSLPNWTRGDVVYAIFTNLTNKPISDPDWAGLAKKMANQVLYAKYFTETMAVDTVDLAKLRSVVGSVNESSVVSGDLTSAINSAIDTQENVNLKISGSVAGLEPGGQIKLLNNGLNSVIVTANGTFSIGSKISSGESYSITVAVNPENQICNVIDGTGIFGPSDPIVKVVCEYKNVFSIKSAELPDLKTYFADLCGNAQTGHNVQNVAPVDLNRDGLMDLVINIWCSPRPSGGVYNGPTPSRVLAFVQDASGSFFDRTAETFGVPKVDMGGVGEYVVTSDFNGDGWRDIVFSLNREDGRTLNSPADAQWARNVALMSSGAGRYSVVPFGLPAWNASMFLIDNASGGQDLITTNFSLGPQSWTYRNAWTSLSGYDWVSNSALFFRGNPAGSASIRALLSTYSPQIGVQPWALVDGVWKGGVGQYLNTSTIQKLCCGNAAPSGATMVSVDGKDYVDAGYGFSCEFRKTPSSPPIALVHFNGQEIVGGYKGQTIVYGQTPLIGTDRLLAYSFSADGTSVSRVSMTVSNEVQQSLESNQMQCGDVNGDGFDDVYFMRSKRDLMPVVYLNDGAGNLKLADAAVFPKSPDSSGLTNFVLADMDGDGVQDLIYFPIYTPSGSYNDLRIRIHKGLRTMRQSDAKK